MHILSTDRLLINEISLNDAPFLLSLMNDKDWILNIGDRGLRTVDDAETYIKNRFFESYKQHGFGFYVLKLKSDQRLIGVAGLIDREGLDHVDIGYGLLPEYRGKGYAFEASKAIFDYGRETLGLSKIVAIVNPNNQGSIKLLEKLGLQFEKMVRLPEEEKDIMLFS